MALHDGRFGAVARTALVVSLLFLVACETGSTDVVGGTTGPTAATATGPTATGPTAQTGTTGALEGNWDGMWATDIPQVSGTFSLQIAPTANGFKGAINIQGSPCVSGGDVEVTLEGDRISFGVVEAEQEIAFEGTVSGDVMSGTFEAGSCPPPNTGTWEAVRSA